MQRAQSFEAGIPSGGTVYLTAADAEGMMVSMIQSNNVGFGSGVVVSGTGISLHNRARISLPHRGIRIRSHPASGSTTPSSLAS
jgi:gamma-glutamyltranspeptidase/glutathione hydrolase